MGGYVAWEFWRRHRERLGRLILCDTRASSDSPEAARQRHATAERVLREGTRFLADEMVPKLFSGESLKRDGIVEATTSVIRSTAPESIAAALRGMAGRSDFRSELNEIRAPSLVICGVDDGITPSAEMREMASALRDARFVSIPAAGHLAPLENPTAVNDAILDFL